MKEVVMWCLAGVCLVLSFAMTETYGHIKDLKARVQKLEQQEQQPRRIVPQGYVRT